MNCRYYQRPPEHQAIADLNVEVRERYGVKMTAMETHLLYLLCSANCVALWGMLVDALWPQDEDAFEHDRYGSLKVLKHKLAKKVQQFIEIGVVDSQGYYVKSRPSELLIKTGD